MSACAVGTVLRFHDIAARALWLDEAYSAWFAALDWRTLWIETPQYETHPPFYYSLLKLWSGVAGDGAGALRSLSAVAGIAAIVVLASAARLLTSVVRVPRPLMLVGVAATLVAVSPRLLLIGQEARTYGFMFLAYTVALIAWLRLARAFATSGDAPGAVRDWLLLGCATSALTWLHGVGVLYAATIALASAVISGKPAWTPRWRRLIATNAAVALVWLPALAMILTLRNGWAGGWLTWDAAEFPVALGNLYGLAAIGEDWSARIAFVLVPVLFYLAVKRIAARLGGGTIATGLVLLTLAPPLMAALLSQMGTPIFLPRTLVAVLAPAYLLIAFALADLPRGRAWALGTALAATFALNLVHYVQRPEFEPWSDIADTIEAAAQPGDVVWVYSNDIALPLARELDAAIPVVPLPGPYPAILIPGRRPSGGPGVGAIDATSARQLRDRYRPAAGRILYLDYAPHLFDPDGSVADALASGRAPTPVRQWGEYRLRMLR